MSSKIVFMGTAGFAVPSLERLIEHGAKPVAVVTGPDKKRGRGQKVSFTPVKTAALAGGIDTVLQPESVKDPAFAEELAQLAPDIIVVVAFKILPPAVYQTALKGAFNLHGSILPRYRGAAPINRAVMEGDEETGVTTFFLEQRVDTGSIILQRSMPIGPNETAGEVHDRMMELGADAVLETVRLIESGNVPTTSQDGSLATRAPKIFKEDCLIDWTKPSIFVHNHIRGLSPYPGAWTMHGANMLKILKAVPAEGQGTAGQVLEADDTLVIACKEGAIEILQIQQEGRKRMGTADFLRGYQIEAGALLQ
ncbi:MAG: methionyl-tRNA formyltransferase [Rhodothermales bacterium]